MHIICGNNNKIKVDFKKQLGFICLNVIDTHCLGLGYMYAMIVKTKAFNFFKSKNKNLQPPRKKKNLQPL